MSDKHFTLDIDPEALRTAATKVGNLAESLGTKGTQVSGTPAEIADRWQGSAAADIQAEMTALGGVLSGFGTDLGALPEAIRSLATEYDEALARLPELNQKWEQAEQDYQDAVTAAGNALTQGREDARGDDGEISESDSTSLETARDDAVADAGDARQTTQHNLELDFGYLKQWLAQQTAALGTTMRESGPLDVPDSAIEAWRNGEGPQIDRTPLFSSLILTKQREVELVTPDVEEAVDALNDALEEGDQEAVNEALDEIAAHADDPVWSEALARSLTPEQMQELYLQIDQGLQDGDLYLEDMWSHLEGFNETVANGVSQLPDDDFADYLNTWMEQDYGPKMWALIASADSADGRINAAAIAHHSEVYNSALSDGIGMPGLFPQVFTYAYPDSDQMEQWADRSSGEDLARILENCSPEEIQEIMFRMHNVQVDGGTMNEDDYQIVADLYAEAIHAMQERFHDAQAAGHEYDLAPLVEALKARHTNAGRPPYDEMLSGLAEDIVNDPALLVQLLADAEDNRIKPSDLKDIIGDSGVDPDDLIEAVINHQLNAGDDPMAVATSIGLLLRADDILGEEFKWDGVVKSVVKDLLGAAGRGNPLSGPVIGVLDAVVTEIERIEQLDQAWDSAAEKNAAQELLAFSLYVQAYGVPEGFDDFVAANNGQVPDHELVNRYLDELRRNPNDDWETLKDLIEAIDETRDEE